MFHAQTQSLSSRHTRNTRPATLSRTCAPLFNKIHSLYLHHRKVTVTRGGNRHEDEDLLNSEGWQH